MSLLSKIAQHDDAYQAICQHAIIINGHGGKTNLTFDIKDHTLLTPGDLNNPYVLSVDPNFNLENYLHDGVLKPLDHGHWTFYDGSISTMVPDVSIAPWHATEINQFAQRILTDKGLWSEIDNQTGLYLERDAGTTLVVKHNQGYEYLDNHQTAETFQKIIANEYNFEAGVPLFMYAPGVGKVKVLGNTLLSEVLTQVEMIDPDQLVLLATCNAGHHSESIHINPNGQGIPLYEVAQEQLDLSATPDHLSDPTDVIDMAHVLKPMADIDHFFTKDSFETQNTSEIAKLTELNFVDADHSTSHTVVSFDDASFAGPHHSIDVLESFTFEMSQAIEG